MYDDANTTPPAFEDLQTNKTDETYDISNAGFMQAVFGTLPHDISPVIASFEGQPCKAGRSAWTGHRWTAGGKTNAAHNNYFSLSSYRPDEAGQYRRRKCQFTQLHAIMLDDIGTKVPLDRLALPPSWMLETSPGNFQVGYILEEPITDALIADRLMKAIIADGWCDPGAGGPTARLARLPKGVNGKHNPVFNCRLIVWEPDNRYSTEDIAEGLGLKSSGSRSRTADEFPPPPEPERPETWVYRPRLDKNPVVVALQRRGLHKNICEDRKHDITCPWVAEHTEANDNGSAYFEPDVQYPRGGFKCLHGHCSERDLDDLLNFLGMTADDAHTGAIIRVIAGEIPAIVNAADAELAAEGGYYQRGGLIVSPVVDPGTREVSVQEYNDASLSCALSKVANWQKFSDKYGWRRVDPPEHHTMVLYKTSAYQHMPVLNNLARQPFFRPDGSLVDKAGYDEPTNMFAVFAEEKFRIKPAPTKEDAIAALVMLVDLLTEFKFAKPSDRSAALSAILTAAIRSSLPQAPMFHVRAPQSGSGKSYLCSVIIAFATPKRGSPTTFPADDEECRKLLLAELLHAPAVIEFDNLTSDLLPHKSLCIVLSSEWYTGRILQVSKTASVSTRTLFLSSGNNVGPVADMARRCITLTLDTGCESPATRSFANPTLVQDVFRNRERHVSAALTIIRAWIVAGRPMTQCKPVAGYQEWSDMCRQPLLWLEQEDPAAAIFEALLEDPERDMLGRMLAAWQKMNGAKPTMIRQVLQNIEYYAAEGEDLKEIFMDVAGERGEVNRRILGRWIKRHAGRIVDGMRFVKASGNRSAEAWYVESVLPV